MRAKPGFAQALLLLALALSSLSVRAELSEPWRCDNSVLRYEQPNPDALPVLQQNTFNVLVWNIYKSQRADWEQMLNQLSADKHLVLLQEARSDKMEQWPARQQFHSYLSAAFSWLGSEYGVMNLSRLPAEASCVQLSPETILRIPKSVLVQRYWLSEQAGGEAILVANVHSTNFSLGLGDYKLQLADVAALLKEHQGPLLVAGDFNTWSEPRSAALKGFAKQLGLQFATFSPDKRSLKFGQHLDHVLYRGLQIEESATFQSDASDHNAMSVSFSLKRSPQ